MRYSAGFPVALTCGLANNKRRVYVEAAILPFHPAFDEATLLDLQERLAKARWPEPETVEDWSQGMPLGYTRELAHHWQHDYDYSRVASTLSRWPNFLSTIDDIDIHFIYQRSPHSQATPLLLTHGWPGSVLEFRHMIERLTEPTRFGGQVEDAFHVVVPSLPGYGFSGKPAAPGTGVQKIAQLWEALMQRLGFDRFLAHGGDWGSMVTQAIALQQTTACASIHITLPVVSPDPATMDELTPEEVQALEAFNFYQEWDSGYSKQQSTRPQTLGYGLADSPVGQMAWIIEKYAQWCDCVRDGVRHPENAVTRDELLDTVMMYWCTNSAASSAKLYWESFNQPDLSEITLPLAISLFPTEIFRTSKRWAQQRFTNLIYFNADIQSGGHFAALEAPQTLTEELWHWKQRLRDSAIL
jgi:pimeloyl-ACP methyl ester carboxylesterase